MPYLLAVQTPVFSLYCDVPTPRNVEACALNFLDIACILVRSDNFSYLCRSDLFLALATNRTTVGQVRCRQDASQVTYHKTWRVCPGTGSFGVEDGGFIDKTCTNEARVDVGFPELARSCPRMELGLPCHDIVGLCV